VAKPPESTGADRTPNAVFVSHEGTNGDEVIGVGGVTDAEKKA